MEPVTRFRAVLAGALASLGVASSSLAQQPRKVSPRLSVVTRPIVLPRRDSTAARDRRIEAPAIVKGEPRSVQLIAVALPASMPRDRRVSFTVFATGAAAILSRRTGQLDPRVERAPRVLVTLGVQAQALAGRTTVAEVEFNAPGVETAVVPVILEVSAVRRVEVMAMTRLVVARLGEKARVHYRVTNLGNGPDTVRVRLAGQEGWLSRSLNGSMLVLPVTASADGALMITVPAFAATGVNTLQLVADGVEGERGRGALYVEVTPLAQRAGAEQLALIPSLTVAAQGSTVRDVVFGSGLRGRIYGDVSVDGHWQQQPTFGAPGLGRVGGYGTLPYLSIFANSWRLDAGNAGTTFSELTGLSAQGRGASFTFNGERWSLLSLAARPSGVYSLEPSASQGYYGARVGRSFGATKLTSGITHLDDGRLVGGQLDAVSVGVSTELAAAAHADGELAYRSFENGAGVGAVANFDQRSRLGALRVRLSHAPGGAGAFALATNDASLFATRSLTPVTRLGLNSWYSDNAAGFGAPQQRSRGASVSPSTGLNDHLSIGGELRATAFDFTEGALGDRLGSTSRSASAFANTQIKSFNVGGSVSYAIDSRNSSTQSSSLFNNDQRQLQWNAQAAARTRFAIVELNASAQLPVGAAAFLSGQNETQLRVHEIRVPVFGRDLLMGAGLGRIGSFGSRAPIYTQRFEAASLLPGGVLVRFDAERNPLFSYGGTQGGWSTALRLERSLGIPSISGGETGGEVYEDENGNGLRDRAEKGISGVIIRAAGEVAVTDAAGRYRFTRQTAAIPQIDERTLPFGWVPASQRGARVRDFGIVPLSSAEVQLQITGAVGDRLAGIDLLPSVVIARDSADRAWIARMDRHGLGRFDALPPGHYRIEVDVSRVTEPLNVPAELPVFRTSATRLPQRLVVLLSTRPTRIWRAGDARPDTLKRAPITLTPPAEVVVRAVADTAGAPRLPDAPAITFMASGIAKSAVSPHLLAPKLPGMTSRLTRAHTVLPNEYLRILARRYLGDENRWPEIFALNRERIRHPDLLRTGIGIVIPLVGDDSTSRIRPRARRRLK